MSTGERPATRTDGRRHRADGERSRQAILNTAASLATVQGLDGLSIGLLAEHVGMSKSGLYAHFGSKEELQLATVDTALEIFTREVTEPALAAPEGIARVLGLCEAFLSYLERRVFPGGCFFISAAAELDAKHGPVSDHLRDVYGGILEGFAEIIERARELGEIDAGEDVAQLVFEIDSLLLGANIAYVFFGDQGALDRARLAINERLDRAAAPRRAPARSGSRAARRTTTG
jgi:AcrR family transcriptional regulator